MLFEQVMIKMFFLKPFLQRVSLNFGVVGYIILPMGQLVVGKMWLTQEFFAFNTKQKKISTVLTSSLVVTTVSHKYEKINWWWWWGVCGAGGWEMWTKGGGGALIFIAIVSTDFYWNDKIIPPKCILASF